MSATSSSGRTSEQQQLLTGTFLHARDRFRAVTSCASSDRILTLHFPDPVNRPSTANSFRSPKPVNDGRTSTPSVSPLSNASRNLNDSTNPSHTTKPSQHGKTATASEPTAQSPDKSEADRSSSLSDFDDSLEDQEQPDTIPHAPQAQDEENESEAETELLERTPQKPWKASSSGKTPSKLNQQSSYEEQASKLSLIHI